jgi:hypothetical protein
VDWINVSNWCVRLELLRFKNSESGAGMILVAGISIRARVVRFLMEVSFIDNIVEIYSILHWYGALDHVFASFYSILSNSLTLNLC